MFKNMVIYVKNNIGKYLFSCLPVFLYLLLKFHEAIEDFLVGFADTTEVATEAVFVETILCFDIPKAASVGTEFVAQHECAIFEATKFSFEIDQDNIEACKQWYQ